MSHHHQQLISQAMQLAMSVGMARGKQLSAQKDAELTAIMRKLELEAEKEQIEAQKAVMLTMIETISQLRNREADFKDRQLELVFMTFKAAHDLIANHHAELLAEKRELRRARLSSPLSADDKIALMQRMGQIENDLLNVTQWSARTNNDANRFAASLSQSFRLPSLPMVE